MGRVDWDVMKVRYWNNTNADPDRKERRQAEFLVKTSVAWRAIIEIGVYNQKIKAEVLDVLTGLKDQPDVWVKRNWFWDK